MNSPFESTPRPASNLMAPYRRLAPSGSVERQVNQPRLGLITAHLSLLQGQLPRWGIRLYEWSGRRVCLPLRVAEQ